MAAETLRDIIRHGAEAYGEQTAFRYKVKKEIIDKSYNEVNLDSMAVSRALEFVQHLDAVCFHNSSYTL